MSILGEGPGNGPLLSLGQKDQQMTQYETILGELISYPEPDEETKAFLERAIDAAEDPRVSNDQLIELIYGLENPILEHGRFEGRGAVTKEVLKNPLYRVFLDLLDHKRVALGETSAAALREPFKLKVSEAAEIAGVTPDAIRKAVRDSRLTGIETPDGIRIDPRGLRSWVETRKPRGKTKGAALKIRMGSAAGKSFRVKFAELKTTGKAETGDGGAIVLAEVPSFTEGAICFSEKKPNGRKINRCFILEPTSERTSEYTHGPFGISGRFKVKETENHESRSAALFKSFSPK